MVVAEPSQAGLDSLLKKMYELYADYALKNPFYSLDMPIRCELFDTNLQVLIEQIERTGITNVWFTKYIRFLQSDYSISVICIKTILMDVFFCFAVSMNSRLGTNELLFGENVIKNKFSFGKSLFPKRITFHSLKGFLNYLTY